MQRTLVLIKPDGVQRGLIGRILQRFEDKGLKLVGLKMRCFPRSLLERHYAAHRERSFYPGLLRFMTSGPVIALALEGDNAVAVVRRLIGDTSAQKADPGTIRGDFGMSVSFNLVHGSDSEQTAQNELALFFSEPGELVEWTADNSSWIYDLEDLAQRA